MFYLTLALIAVPCALYYYFTRTFNYWKNRNVAFIKPVPVFGNLFESTLRRRHISEVLSDTYRAFPKEKVVGVYRMTTPCLLIRDLDVLKHVMIKDFDMFLDRGVEFSKEGLGANLFHADGETWRVLRNRLTPIFTTGKLKNMLHLMLDCGDKFVNYVDKEITKSPEQDVFDLLQKFFIINIGACAFGLDIDIMQDSRVDTLNKIDKATFTISFFQELDMMYPGILKKLNSSIFPRYVQDFFFGLAADVTKQRNNMPSDRKDFMDLLLELRNQKEIEGTQKTGKEKLNKLEITDSVIAAQSFVFFAAGYETSSNTVSFMLYQLAHNPHVQDKLIAEIDEVLAKNNGEITYEVMQEMVYLEKVFNETLRMYPVVDPLQRNAQQDYKIPGTDVVVEKGQTILVSCFGIHYDENIYPNPHIFDPERFTAENCGKRHPCAFMAFGVGPRNCIGMRFSKVSSRVCLVKFLSKFRVTPSKNTQSNMKFSSTRFVVSPGGGIPLNIVPRVK